MRLVIISTAIALLIFSQSSGTVAADTKLDLIVDPARFLHRAMTLWDSDGASGQLQDRPTAISSRWGRSSCWASCSRCRHG